MEFLNSILEANSMPWLSALVLGLMTAISPCPLATNITAIGFISKDVENRNRVFLNGIFYTVGRVFAYTSIAVIIYFGADQFKFGGYFQRYGELFIGPVLLIIGFVMLGVIHFNIPGMGNWGSRMQNKKQWNYLDTFLLGVVFALAFCPYSGVLYFGMLIPMTISSASGLILPPIFAIATGIPVIIFAYIIAYTISGIGKAYNSIKAFELWFRRLIAILFIIVGLYYTYNVYLR